MDTAYNYSHGYGGTGLNNIRGLSQQHPMPTSHQQHPMPTSHQQQHPQQNIPQNVPQNTAPPQQPAPQNVAPPQQPVPQNAPPPQQSAPQNIQQTQQPPPQLQQPQAQYYQQPQGYEHYSHPNIQSPLQNQVGPMGDYYLKQQQNFYRNQAYEGNVEPNGDKSTSTSDVLSHYSVHTGKKHGHTHADAYVHRQKSFKDYFMKTQVDEFGTEHSSISKSKFAVAMAIGGAAMYATKKGVDRFRDYRAEKRASELDNYPYSSNSSRSNSCSSSQHGYDPYN
ncbi:hypothetical protein COEREDRAFT_80803 [Coemansia reversa NRRL 1564]|uniref:Uncharacterized protein n=1 Tax=Coemansia reversa (strain ATCC 12441 / NRRL 1564) TaxID=763665 RepID=A0A2G5BDL4_COERN|nr:hypothetical protein COEREDRAFT_80803 [Coemansia reversa NRRL 1564]|eukprot:PIA17095.1 hypothetical protein COEREDRAFT_80803 [Coemansia reversa NRRL 1564]